MCTPSQVTSESITNKFKKLPLLWMSYLTVLGYLLLRQFANWRQEHTPGCFAGRLSWVWAMPEKLTFFSFTHTFCYVLVLRGSTFVEHSMFKQSMFALLAEEIMTPRSLLSHLYWALSWARWIHIRLSIPIWIQIHLRQGLLNNPFPLDFQTMRAICSVLNSCLTLSP
jgi:hypothetical protein